MKKIFCVGCGYDLRSLLPSGKCPECGRLVWPSLRIVPGSNMTRSWVKRLADAFGYLFVAFVLSAVLTTGLLAAHLVGIADVAADVARLCVLRFRQRLLGLRDLGVGFLPNAKTLTNRQPLATASVGWSAFSCLRVAAGCSLFVVGSLCGWTPTDEWVADVAITGASLAGLCVGVGLGLTFYLTSRFGRQIPGRAVALQARLIGGMWLILAGLLCVGGLGATHGVSWGVIVLMVITGCWDPGNFGDFDRMALEGLLAMLLLPSLWALPLMLWYRRRFLEAAKVAAERKRRANVAGSPSP